MKRERKHLLKGFFAFVMAVTLVVGSLPFPWVQKVSANAALYYIDDEGNSVNLSNGEYVLVSNSEDDVTWDDSTKIYVVSEDVEIEGDIEIEGSVTLLLCDGAELDNSEGSINGTGTLSVFGQEAGTGKLIAGDIDFVGYNTGIDLYVYGGELEAEDYINLNSLYGKAGTVTVDGDINTYDDTNAGIIVVGGKVTADNFSAQSGIKLEGGKIYIGSGITTTVGDISITGYDSTSNLGVTQITIGDGTANDGSEISTGSGNIDISDVTLAVEEIIANSGNSASGSDKGKISIQGGNITADTIKADNSAKDVNAITIDNATVNAQEIEAGSDILIKDAVVYVSNSLYSYTGNILISNGSVLGETNPYLEISASGSFELKKGDDRGSVIADSLKAAKIYLTSGSIKAAIVGEAGAEELTEITVNEGKLEVIENIDGLKSLSIKEKGSVVATNCSIETEGGNVWVKGGSLYTEGINSSSGEIIFNNAEVKVDESVKATGAVSITGGKVTVGKDTGCGISSGSGDITLNWNNNDDSIYAEDYSVSNGKQIWILKNFVIGDGSLATSSNIAGQLLKPAYEVSFKDGVNTLFSKYVTRTDDKTVEEPESPEKDGNIFCGWYSDSQLSAKFDFSEPIKKDTDVYARFEPVTVSGKVGENDGITWLYSENAKTLKFTGTGIIPDYDENYDACPWKDLYSDVETLVIAEGITGIGAYDFYNFTALKNISWPETISSIGMGAFSQSGIESITIPSGVSTLSEDLFSGCEKLMKVFIKNSITAIEEGALDNCIASGRFLIYTGTEEEFYDIEGIEYICSLIGSEPENLWDLQLNYVEGNLNIISVQPDNIGVHIEWDKYHSAKSFKIEQFINNAWAALAADNIAEIENGYAHLTKLENYKTYIFRISAYDGADCTGTLISQSEQFEAIPSDIVDSGIVTDGITWKYMYDDSLIISGTGAMPDDTIDNPSSWDKKSYVKSVMKKVVIENGITHIGDYAFYDCPYLEEAVISGSVVSIGSYAFSDCDKLETVTLNNGLKRIGYNSFSDTGIMSINIPSSVTDIDNYAFYDCEDLFEVTLNEGLLDIGKKAFCETGLETVSIPASVREIGIQAFNGADFKSITVKEGSENYIANNGVLFSSDGKTLVLYPSEKSDITYSVPSDTKVIGDFAFEECSYLTNIVLNDSLEKIGASAFMDCEKLSGITLSEKIEILERNAFRNCENLTSITLKEGLKTIGSKAFSNTGLTSIEIPASVEVIKNAAFLKCPLVSISVKEENQAYVSVDGVLFTADGKKLEVYPMKKEGITFVVPEGTEIISDYAFYGNLSLKNVIVSDGVTEIGDYAFYKCKGITNIYLSEKLALIGESAFEICENLKEISLPNSLKKIRDFAFGTTLITEIDIPDGVTELGDGVFSEDSLNKVILPATLTKGRKYFKDCDSVKDVYFVGTKEQWDTLSARPDLSNVTVEEVYEYFRDYYLNVLDYTQEEYVELLNDPDELKQLTDEYINYYTNFAILPTETVLHTDYRVALEGYSISDIPARTYNGEAYEPQITVTNGTDTLKEGIHYTVAYSNNVAAGTAKATVSGTGRYTISLEKPFTISLAESSLSEASYGVEDLTYTGEALPLINGGVSNGGDLYFAVTDSGAEAPDSSLYSKEAPKKTNAGSYTVWYKVVGDDNHTGSEVYKIDVKIGRKVLSSPEIMLSSGSFTYDGEEKKPEVTMMDGSEKLAAGDYTVSYSDNIKAGKATVSVTGNENGNYDFSGKAYFNIAEKPVVILGLGVSDKEYDGSSSAIVTGTPSIEGVIIDTETGELCGTTKPGIEGNDIVSVSLGSASFEDANAGKDKTVTFSGFTLTGDDAANYKLFAQPESVKASITAKSLSTAVVTLDRSSFTWDGNEKTVSVKSVKLGDKVLTSETDYTVSGNKGTSVNTYAVTVEGKGNYTGKATVNWSISAPANNGNGNTNSGNGTNGNSNVNNGNGTNGNVNNGNGTNGNGNVNNGNGTSGNGNGNNGNGNVDNGNGNNKSDNNSVNGDLDNNEAGNEKDENGNVTVKTESESGEKTVTTYSDGSKKSVETIRNSDKSTVVKEEYSNSTGTEIKSKEITTDAGGKVLKTVGETVTVEKNKKTIERNTESQEGSLKEKIVEKSNGASIITSTLIDNAGNQTDSKRTNYSSGNSLIVTDIIKANGTKSHSKENIKKDGSSSKETVNTNSEGNITSILKSTTDKKGKTEKETYQISSMPYVNKNGKKKAGTVKLKTIKANTSTVTIPGTINTDIGKLKVTAIKNNAMAGNKKVKSLVIGANISSIGKRAFADCINLNNITFKSSKIVSIGKKAFSNIAENAVFTINTKDDDLFNKLVDMIKAAGADTSASFVRG